MRQEDHELEISLGYIEFETAWTVYVYIRLLSQKIDKGWGDGSLDEVITMQA